MEDVSRRKLLRASVWAAPVVAVAAAAPARAASESTIPASGRVYGTYPRLRAAEISYSVTNPGPDPLTIVVTASPSPYFPRGATYGFQWTRVGDGSYAITLGPGESNSNFTTGRLILGCYAQSDTPPDTSITCVAIVSATGYADNPVAVAVRV